MLIVSTALLPASSRPVIVYTYLTLFCRPVSSKLEARPLKTVVVAAPSLPGARSMSISFVSADAVQDSVAVPSSQSVPRFVSVGGVESYLNAGDVPPAVFPALSRQLPLTVVLDVSGPAYVTAVHDPIPEPPSEPRNATWTGWLYHPLLSGGRSNVTLSIDGALASYFTPTPAEAELPALSVHVAVPEPPPPSVPPLHEAIPERLSLPLVPKWTGRLYELPKSRPRDTGRLTEGGVASY